MPSYAEQVIADGATLYLRLDEASGNVVSKVGGYTGTVSGGVTRSQLGALSDGNTAMLFNGGTVDKILVSPSVTLPAPCTVEAWIKTTAAGQMAIVCLRPEINFLFGVDQNPVATSLIWTGGSLINGTRKVNDGAWHHLVTVLTGTRAQLYVDGVLDVDVANAYSTQTGPVRIGFDANNNLTLTGSIDEVAIYPTALTPAQISNHYALRTYSTAPLGAYAQRVLSDGATLYLRLDEPSGTTVTSKVGGYTGTISGGVTLNQSGALADGNTAMLFGPTEGQIVVPNGTYQAVGTGAFTLECWVKRATATDGYVLDNHRGGAVTGFDLVFVGTTIWMRCAVVPGPIQLNLQNVPYPTDGQWHHLAMSVGRLVPNDTITCFIDGVATAGTLNRDANGLNFSAIEQLFIAKFGGSGIQWFQGTLDEVAIYPTALSAAQIAAHYALAAPTYADRVLRDGASLYMRLDETSGTTAYSKVGGYTGTISGGVTLGRSGALADGNTAMALVGTTGSITTTFSTPTIVTVEAWIYRTGPGAGQPRIYASGVNQQVELSIDANANVSFLLAFTDATFALWIATGVIIALGQWCHVVLSWDGTTVRVYRNGVEGYNATTWAGKTLKSGGAASIGLSTQSVDGVLDEVAVYPTALSSAQIADHYAARLLVLDTTPAPYVAAIPPPSGPVLSRWLPQPINDGVDTPFSQLWIGGAGTLAAVAGDGTVVTFAGVQAGTRLPIAGRRINSSGTTCTNILSLQAP